MIETYDVRGDVQYQWSMDGCSISISRGGKEFVRGRITVVGTVSLTYGAWLWSWANDSLPPKVLGDIGAVREHGTQNAFPLLVWPSFRADHKPVTQARIVAADLLAAEGIWLDIADDLETH